MSGRPLAAEGAAVRSRSRRSSAAEVLRERVLARFAAHALRDARPARVLRRAVAQVRRALQADAAELVTLGPRGTLRVAYAGAADARSRLAACGPVDAPHAALALARGSLRCEVRQDAPLGEPWRQLGMRSVLCVPVRPRARMTETYVLCVFGRAAEQFDRHDRATLESFALVLAAALVGPRDSGAPASGTEYRSVAVLLESFSAVLAHEVRNPLNALAMNAEVAGLLLQRQRVEQIPAVLERIARDVQRCGIAIRELSIVAARDGASEAVPVQDLLDQVAERLRRLGYVPEPTLETRVEPPELLVIGNAAVLEFALLQVARALLMPGVEGLTLSAQASPGRLAVTIERRGGMLEHRARFDAPMPPTRAAALALARHALAGMGATVSPDDLDGVPLACTVVFPQTFGLPL